MWAGQQRTLAADDADGDFEAGFVRR